MDKIVLSECQINEIRQKIRNKIDEILNKNERILNHNMKNVTDNR